MSEKLRLKNEDEYATYEEYNDIMDISMSLSNENQSLQSQLDIANKKLDKIENKIKCLGKFDGEQCTRSFKMWTADFNEILSIIGDKR